MSETAKFKWTPLKVIGLILALAGLALALFFGLKSYKRKKILEGLSAYAKEKGLKIDEEALKKNLKELTNKELDDIAEFAKAAQGKKYVEMVGMAAKIMPILTKLNLIALLS